MNQYSNAMIVLLIDFDDNEKRFSFLESDIPDNLRNRVFIIGIWSNPEALRRNTKKDFEIIGETLANNCGNRSGGDQENVLHEIRRNHHENMTVIDSLPIILNNQSSTSGCESLFRPF